MKKITIILALVLTVSTSFAFTGGESVNNRTQATFNNEFTQATNPTWTVSKDFDKVSFSMNGQQLVAYYNKAGEFMAVTRNISSLQLPANLRKSLKKVIGSSWITDLFEITNLDDTSWYVTLETADTKIVLKSEGGRWTTFQHIDK